MDRIPLFPLRVVLFPGMPLPLRVFEPRYHRMLADCAARGQGFGVALIRDGPEVGGYAEPVEVGTLATVEHRADQGPLAYVLARGGPRFRILRTLRDQPYLEGEVAWLPDPSPGTPHHGPEAGHGHHHLPVELEVAALFDEYLRLLGTVTRVPLDEEVLALLRGKAADPWDMACAVGAALLVPPAEKQPLLAAASVHDALHLAHALLSREAAKLQVLARRVGAGLN